MAMKARDHEPDYTSASADYDSRIAYIISDQEPNSVLGTDIDNFPDNARVSFGSYCIDYTTKKRYIVGLDNAWHEI